MTTKVLSQQQLVNLAVAANATSPTGSTGAIIWSTTTNSLLYWNGTAWTAFGSGSGSAGVDAIAVSFFGAV